MRGLSLCFGFVTYFCLLAALPVLAQSDLDALLAEYPAQSPDDARTLAQRLLDLGPDAIAAACDRLVPMGAGDDNAARYALSGTAAYVIEEGSEQERLIFANAILRALDAEENTEVQSALIELLRTAGKNECVGPLVRFLHEPVLCDPAARTLTSIGTPEVGQALLDALSTAEGTARLSIINALGALSYSPAVTELMSFAVSDDIPLRDAASDALAHMAPAEVLELLLSQSHTPDPVRTAQGMARCLVYAQRRAAQGDIATCRQVCADFLSRGAADAPEHILCGALTVIAQADPEYAASLASALLEWPSRTVRYAALEIVANTPGIEVTERWCANLRSARPEVRPEIVAMLGRRGDRVARNALLEALNDGDAAVRFAAIEALPNFGGARVAEALLDCMRRASEDREIRALQDALLRFSADQLGRRVAASLPNVSPQARMALIEVLAARRITAQADAVFQCVQDSDGNVRIAAVKALADITPPEGLERVLQVLLIVDGDEEREAAVRSVVAVALQTDDAEARVKPLLAALDRPSGEAKARVLSVMPHIDGGRPALNAVTAAAQDADAAVKQAALQALADWKQIQALEPILEACRANAAPETRELLLRGYTRIVRETDRSDGKKLQLLENAMGSAETPEQKRILMKAVAQYRTVGALRLMLNFLEEPALQSETAAAMAQMACPRDEKDTGLRAHAVARALEKALPFLTDEDTRTKAQQHIAAMPQPDAEGFVPLFNGVDLTGWTGDLAGYAVQDGAIVCKPTSHANLYSDLDYADFVLRLEFRLTPGANNGIGIRTPLYGHAAYDGMEVQVLDDSAPEHADLKPHQYHGSLYGLVPAERGRLKPVGEWNEQEIMAEGTHILITLNGATIVDADLEQFRDKETPDGKEHPGLFNKSGRIAFLGHGAQVEYRNIRIKELE